MRLARIALIGVTLAGAACETAFDCTQVETFPVEIVPVDAMSGAPVADSTAATAERDGAAWQLGAYRRDGTGRLLSLWGGSGPGLYAIQAHHPRYERWDTAGVVIEAVEGCERFVPVQITVRLVQQ